MKRSEESITPLTPTIFHSPHHGYRFFANALNDVLPSPVILNGARILCGETGKQNDETERWICYPSWLPRFSILLITAIDSSLTLWMTPYRPPSFWTGVRILCGETDKQNDETEWRIYLLWWHLTAPIMQSAAFNSRQKGWQKSGKCLPLLLTSQTGRIFHLHG